MRDAFGPGGPSLTSDLVLEGMDGRTAQEALEAGIAPQVVWEAVWVTAELDEALRFPHRANRRRREQQ